MDTHRGEVVAGGAVRGHKRHSQATFPKSTEFEDSWPFLSFFLSYSLWKRKTSGSEDSRALFMPLSLSLSLSCTRTHAHASSSCASSRVYFVSFLKDSEVSQVQQKQVTILDSFHVSFFSFSFSALIPTCFLFFFRPPILFFFFSFSFFFFFGFFGF